MRSVTRRRGSALVATLSLAFGLAQGEAYAGHFYRSYVIGHNGLKIEYFGNQVGVLRTGLIGSAGEGVLMLSCIGSDRRWRATLPDRTIVGEAPLTLLASGIARDSDYRLMRAKLAKATLMISEKNYGDTFMQWFVRAIIDGLGPIQILIASRTAHTLGKNSVIIIDAELSDADRISLSNFYESCFRVGRP